MIALADLNLTAFDVDRLTMAEADVRRWVVPISEATVAGGRGRVYDTAERFRRRLDRAEALAVRDVIDAWGKVRSNLDDELNRLDQLIKDGEGTEGVERARRRLTEQRQQLTKRVDDYARQVRQTVATSQATAADLGADGVKAMVDLQLGPRAAAAGVTFSRLPADAVEQMLGQLQSGPLQGVLNRMSSEYADQLGDVLVDGIARGRSPRVVARRLFDIADSPRWKALQVARTETLRAYRESSRRSMMADRDVMAGWTWHAQLDASTCAVCWSMHGTQLPTAEVFGTHPNCRCAALPRTKSFAELGIPGVEEPSMLQVTDGETLFRRQPLHVQRSVLGPGKLQAYQDGQFTLADVVGERFDPDWGQVRFERPLRELVDVE